MTEDPLAGLHDYEAEEIEQLRIDLATAKLVNEALREQIKLLNELASMRTKIIDTLILGYPEKSEERV